eukprot:4208908-Alexandrium_andersonii.AAC.1
MRSSSAAPPGLPPSRAPSITGALAPGSAWFRRPRGARARVDAAPPRPRRAPALPPSGLQS